MPELPEVETVRRGLARLVVGKQIASVSVYESPKSFPNSPEDVEQFVRGATITAVNRRAKVLLVSLSSDYMFVIHLKMTGQLVYVGKERFGAGHPNDSLIGVLPDRSTRVSIHFSDDTTLFFNDQRKFGWVKLYPTIEVPNIDFMQKVGPEPLEDDFTAAVMAGRLRHRNNTTIKAALLDQSVIAGVGNIYADESLWGAKIHPATRVRDVSDAQLAVLHDELVSVLALSIEKGGSTNHTYVNAEGQRGSYMDFARVFRRDELACPRHPDVLIEKLRVAGRGTHICPVCQVLPTATLR